jgi:hypothetical protein
MSSIAPILEQTKGKIRFCVDEVESSQTRLTVQVAKSQLEKSFQRRLLAFSHDDTFQVIEGDEIHPLVLAVHAAFSEHRPLLLSPDIIWITLAQGFAQHINNHAETLRSRFVRHQGKQTLEVESDGIPQHSQQWSEAVQQWALHIRDQVGADLYQLLECNFSTTTPITRTASHIVMMDAFQQYFDYEIWCICGIPHITLLGTVEDWQSICDRVQIMAQYELNWWTARLLPICREFIETVSGRPSLEFWRCIYKPQAVYGADLFTGWLADLFPYIKHPITKAPSVRNPILEIDCCELPNRNFRKIKIPARLYKIQKLIGALLNRESLTQISSLVIDLFTQVDRSISINSLPLGLSQAPLKLKMLEEKEYSLELIAGFIGVRQDSEQGTLQPEIGWAVGERDDRFAELLDKIQQQHLTQPPINWPEVDVDGVPKEQIQLLNRFDGATLYANSGHAWQIVKYDNCKTYELSEPHDYARSLIDLEDGRCIAYVCSFSFYIHWMKYWIILGKPVPYADPYCPQQLRFRLEDVVIIAKDIPQLLERIFESEGHYYFDDPTFIADDCLNNLECDRLSP